MLDILAVLGDQGRAQCCELLSKLREDLTANQVLDGSLGAGIRVDIYVELGELVGLGKDVHGGTGDIQHTRFLQYHVQPRGL